MAEQQEMPIRSVREQIADCLRKEILSDQFTENEPLRESVMAARFGTSRGPIRDVFLQLSQEGALVYKPNSGVRVSSPAKQHERALLMRLRKEIELEVVKHFLELCTEADHQFLGGVLAKMKLACEEENLPEITGNDMAIHQHIVRRGASDHIEAVWKSTAVRIRMDYSRVTQFMDIFYEHKEIVDAIVLGDLKTVTQALSRNLI